MASTQRITWIALPHDFASVDEHSRARVTVFVSPQLLSDQEESLASFELGNWASSMLSGAVTFDLSFGDQVVATRIVGMAQPNLWPALLGPETLVRPHTADTPSLVVGTYPAARMHDLLQKSYVQADRATREGGTTRFAFSEVFGEVREASLVIGSGDDAAGDRRAALAAGLLGRDSRDGFATQLDLLVDEAFADTARRTDGAGEVLRIVPDTGDAANVLAQFMVFHNQPVGTVNGMEHVAGSTANAQVDRRFDFHQRLTMLGEYPELQRKLGLLIELDVAAADIPASTPAEPGQLRVIPHVAFGAVAGLQHEQITPATAYVFEPDRSFAAAQKNSAESMVPGLVDLRHEDHYRVIQLDVDSAGLKFIDLLTRDLAEPFGSEDQVSMPALRSSGVAIARSGQAEDLLSAMAAGAGTRARSGELTSTVLFAEDLVRGYRVDVEDAASGIWRSLHRREGRYRLTAGGADFDATDEGWAQETVVQPGSATSTLPVDVDPMRPNYISEYLFNWQGWSLAAPRPNAALPQPGGNTHSGDAQKLGVEVSCRPVRGSLPRLRFGRKYRFRARTVDLAGNGFSIDQADAVIAGMGDGAPVLPLPGREFRYRRFESVPAPVVVPLGSTDGTESPPEVRIAGVDRIVLRSDNDSTAADFAERHLQYATAAARHIVPPPVWQQLAEMHGAFDASIGTGTGYEFTHQLASREERKIPQYCPDSSMSVDYLPDPLAAGAALWNLPGVAPGSLGQIVDDQLVFTDIPVSSRFSDATSSVVMIDFGVFDQWPDMSGFRLDLAEGDGMPTWQNGVLTVYLPKAQSRAVRLSSYLRDEASLELLGVWQWIREGLRDRIANGDLPAVEDGYDHELELTRLALRGGCRMLTPARDLTLVHAIPRPSGPDPLLAFEPQRIPERTFAYTQGSLAVPDGAATVQLIAEWTEIIDAWDSTEPSSAAVPARVSRRSPVFGQPYAIADEGVPADGINTVPAQRFDVTSGTMEYPGPDLTKMAVGILNAMNELQAAFTGFLSRPDTPLGLADYFPAAPALRQLVERGTVGPETWREVSRLANSVGLSAQGYGQSDAGYGGWPDDYPGGLERPEPDFYLSAEAVGTAATGVAGAADRAIERLRTYLGRHEFGDTKHRTITYQAVLSSRFEEDFVALDDNRPERHQRLSMPVTVDIPSSQIPPTPDIVDVVPIARWNRAYSGNEFRISHQVGLRVYLRRPWFVTGDGEQLGVVVAADPEAYVEEGVSAEHGVSQFGRDPIWMVGDNPVMVGPKHFPYESTTIALGTHATALALMAFDVEFDDNGRCFCDITVQSGDYFRFLKLALVRYQRNSLANLSRSAVVETELAQIMPYRNVTIVNEGPGQLRITVSGAIPILRPDPFGRSRNRISISVQQRIAGTTDDAGWLGDMSGAITVTADAGELVWPVLWSGTVTYPVALSRDIMRLLIEEYEPHTALGAAGNTEPAERVVFVETYPLPWPA